MSEKKIAICIPSRMMIHAEWCVHFCTFLNYINGTHEYQIFNEHDKTVQVDVARERILDRVVADGSCDYMLWLDDDVFFPLDVLDTLLATGKNFVTGIYWNKGNNVPLLMKNSDWYQFDEHETDPLFVVDACGFGCILVKTECIPYLLKPRFYMQSADGTGEDLAFCGRIAGYRAHLALVGGDIDAFQLYASAKALCKHQFYDQEEMDYVVFPDDSVIEELNAKYS